MTTASNSPSGFSYAQAAKAPAPPAPVSAKTTKSVSENPVSGTAPTSTELPAAAAANWAEDVENTEKAQVVTTTKSPVEQSNRPTAQAKESLVERAKSESRNPATPSSISSPDLAASASTTTNGDDVLSATNGTASDTTWEESKSQSSDPAWVAERKERQNAAQKQESTKGDKKGGKGDKDSSASQPPPKPVVLQDAPLPTVNPWARRIEEQKSKVAPAAQSTPAATSNTSAVQSASGPATLAATKVADTGRPSETPRRKAEAPAAVVQESDAPAAQSVEAPKASPSEPRNRKAKGGEQISAWNRNDNEADSISKAGQREHKSLPNIATTSLVNDESSWPTPETAQVMERKESPFEKDAADAGDTESLHEGKARAKTSWKPLPVTPNILWSTPEMNRPRGGGERGGRGGARGRGGLRGTPNGKGPDRSATRHNSAPGETELTNGAATSSRGRSDVAAREAMPPPPKPTRPSSTGGSHETQRVRQSPHPPHSRSKQLPNGDGSSASARKPVHDARPVKTSAQRDASTNGDVEAHTDAKSAEPQAITTTSVEGVREPSVSAPRDHAPKSAPVDGRRESRSFESYTKDYSTSTRGSKRGGRGRGGSREFINGTNGHTSQPFYGNGHADHTSSAAMGVPSSPSTFNNGRGGQYGSSYHNRGGWSRGNPRSQSIPLDNVYGHRMPPALQAVQPFYPIAYDSFSPISPMALMPMADTNYVFDMLVTQLEYYFSLNNLLKDTYLRKNMDSQGFVLLELVAGFQRVQQYHADRDTLRTACMRSEIIEIVIGEDSKDRIRLRKDWQQFVFPMEHRDPSAQNDGPQTLHHPEPSPQAYMYQPHLMQYRGSPQVNGYAQHGRRSHDAGLYGATPMTPQQFPPFMPSADGVTYSEPLSTEETRGRAAKSPIRETNVMPDQQHQQMVNSTAEETDGEPDIFPNDNISMLTVVVKLNKIPRSKPIHAAHRTFSNGSIDSRSIFAELEKPTDEASTCRINGEGDKADGSATGDSAADKTGANSDLTLLWMKDSQVPQEGLPQDATTEDYVHLRMKALKQRGQAATGTCPYDMNVLYQFWSHFLIRNFNGLMYAEFKWLAHNDAQERHSQVGLQNLVTFYFKALHSSSPIRKVVVRDYARLIKNEPRVVQGLPMNQLRTAWQSGALNIRNREKLSEMIDETIREQLES